MGHCGQDSQDRGLASSMRKVLQYYLCFQLAAAQRADFVTEIEPDYGPDWGDWNGGVFCPEHQFAHGFKQKTDSWCSGGGECTGLNAIEFLCGLITEDHYQTTVKEYEGPFGEWHQERLCANKEFLKEAQQNYQSYQGVWVDDSGSNGVSFLCNNGTDLLAGPDTVWRPDNVWTSFVSCPGNSLICGFETKGHTAFPDNSEIDRVKFYCCDPDYQPEQ